MLRLVTRPNCHMAVLMVEGLNKNLYKLVTYIFINHAQIKYINQILMYIHIRTHQVSLVLYTYIPPTITVMVARAIFCMFPALFFPSQV